MDAETEHEPVDSVTVIVPVIAFTEQAVPELTEYVTVPSPTPAEGAAVTVCVAPYARV